MIKDLAKLATRLDKLGLTKEADVLDAALNKLAQDVATTGVAGARYSDGRQVTTGFPGGAVVKFYKAKPKNILEFNAFLGGIIAEFAKNPTQKTFSDAVIKNPPSKSDTTWSQSRTAPAFKEYARAAGFPEAGTDWQKYAKANNYEPTILGIFKFWKDTIDDVEAYRGRDQEEYFSKFMESQVQSAQTAGATGVSSPEGPGYKNFSSTPLPIIQKRYAFTSLTGEIVKTMKEMVAKTGLYNPGKIPMTVWDSDFNEAFVNLAGITLDKAKVNKDNPWFVAMIQGGSNVKNPTPIDQIIKGLEAISLGIPGTGLSPNPILATKVMIDIVQNTSFEGAKKKTPEESAALSKRLLEEDDSFLLESPRAAGATGAAGGATPSSKNPVTPKAEAVKIEPGTLGGGSTTGVKPYVPPVPTTSRVEEEFVLPGGRTRPPK